MDANAPRTDATNPLPPPRSATTPPILLAWGLLLMAGVLIALAVLLPLCDSVRAWTDARRALAAQIDHLRSRIDAHHRWMDALRTSPAANARLAVRELNLRPPGTALVRIDAPDAAPPLPAGLPFDPAPDFPPAAHAPPAADPLPLPACLAPGTPLRRFFAHPAGRTLAFLLASALIIAAFLLAPPRPTGA